MRFIAAKGERLASSIFQYSKDWDAVVPPPAKKPASPPRGATEPALVASGLSSAGAAGWFSLGHLVQNQPAAPRAANLLFVTGYADSFILKAWQVPFDNLHL